MQHQGLLCSQAAPRGTGFISNLWCNKYFKIINCIVSCTRNETFMIINNFVCNTVVICWVFVVYDACTIGLIQPDIATANVLTERIEGPTKAQTKVQDDLEGLDIAEARDAFVLLDVNHSLQPWKWLRWSTRAVLFLNFFLEGNGTVGLCNTAHHCE